MARNGKRVTRRRTLMLCMGHALVHLLIEMHTNAWKTFTLYSFSYINACKNNGLRVVITVYKDSKNSVLMSLEYWYTVKTKYILCF